MILRALLPQKDHVRWWTCLSPKPNKFEQLARSVTPWPESAADHVVAKSIEVQDRAGDVRK